MISELDEIEALLESDDEGGVFELADTDNIKQVENVQTLIRKLRKIVAKFHQSTVLSDNLIEKQV